MVNQTVSMNLEI